MPGPITHTYNHPQANISIEQKTPTSALASLIYSAQKTVVPSSKQRIWKKGVVIQHCHPSAADLRDLKTPSSHQDLNQKVYECEMALLSWMQEHRTSHDPQSCHVTKALQQKLLQESSHCHSTCRDSLE